MASIDDIREWGTRNGWDVSGEGLPRGLRSAYDKRVTDPTEDPEGITERAPVIAKTSPVEAVRNAIKTRRTPAPKARGTKTRPRVSLEGLIGKVWEGLATVTARANLPVSRVFEMQAPVAGMLLEDELRDTLADKFLQPAARVVDGSELAFALMGPPLITAAITMRPDRQDILMPMLRMSFRSWVRVVGDKLDKVEEQKTLDAEFEKRYGERVDDMIARLFAAPPGYETMVDDQS